MSRVAIVAHYERPDVVALIESTMAWLGERGHEGWLLPGDGAELDLVEHAEERPLADADVVVCLGGDGTMLRAVGILDGAPVPLLGVNLGQLGYLTEVEPDGLLESLGAVLDGEADGGWHLDERLMLAVTALRGDEPLGQWRVLNEVVVEKHVLRTHRQPAGADRRRGVHQLRCRRADRGHAHRLDRLFALGTRSSRVDRDIARCC